MDGLLIFDTSNDLIYKHLNDELCLKIRNLARSQDLLGDDDDDHGNVALDNNIILQIFSPIINSQKIMFCQFDNSYSSFQCDGNLNFLFSEVSSTIQNI